MQNITIEELKAMAARLGFHKRPMGDLIKLIEASVQDEVQKIEIFHTHLLNGNYLFKARGKAIY